MSRPFYRITRDLHLYLGLFSSPFVLLFAVSVFFLVHTWLPRLTPETASTRVVTAWTLPADWQKLSGRPLIDALKPGLEKAGVPGEVGFVQYSAAQQKLTIPVTIPGRETTVTLNVASGEATIVTRERGLAPALVTLHKSPGQHGGAIHMNWVFIAAWRWVSDATACLILFVSVSGIYLWYVLRAERRVGFILIFAGAVSFFGMAYALSR